MNRKMVLHTVGILLLVESALLCLPLLIAFLYRGTDGSGAILAFGQTILITLAAGALLAFGFRPKNQVIYAAEGFVIVSLSWLALSLFGCLPFLFDKSCEITSFADAFFETVSGFTTTGASVLRDVESLSHGLLFWRSFTHWVGGMGVLVFIMALLPGLSDRSIHIMRAEMPGPIVGKLVPRIKDTAKILYLIYFGMTLAEVICLLAGGMNLFDSVVHTFGTAGTGGFGIRADSIGSYSPTLQWIIAVFMVLFGINFNLYYLILVKKFRSAFSSGELWTYLAIIFLSTGAIAVDLLVNFQPLAGKAGEAIRNAAFQVSSIVTTTGYTTADYAVWPSFSKAVLLILMFLGACAGSTAGGFKISRVVILFKMVKNELKKMLHPRSVNVVKLDGKAVPVKTQESVSIYFALYIAFFVLIFLLISLFDPFGLETNFSAAASCFNNVGPGFGGCGPSTSYASFTAGSKIILAFAMLLGRLEILPLVLTLSPSAWRKK